MLTDCLRALACLITKGESEKMSRTNPGVWRGPTEPKSQGVSCQLILSCPTLRACRGAPEGTLLSLLQSIAGQAIANPRGWPVVALSLGIFQWREEGVPFMKDHKLDFWHYLNYPECHRDLLTKQTLPNMSRILLATCSAPWVHCFNRSWT
jgi:hypothetical protein